MTSNSTAGEDVLREYVASIIPSEAGFNLHLLPFLVTLNKDREEGNGSDGPDNDIIAEAIDEAVELVFKPNSGFVDSMVTDGGLVARVVDEEDGVLIEGDRFSFGASVETSNSISSSTIIERLERKCLPCHFPLLFWSPRAISEVLRSTGM
jgi:hypothetical protein